MKRIILLLAILCIGCKSDIDLSMERGIQFFEFRRTISDINRVIINTYKTFLMKSFNLVFVSYIN